MVGETFKAHLENLQKVFDCLRQANLQLEPKKCKFASLQVEYLGYCVSGEGISTNPQKTAAVSNFPPPTDLKSLRSFLGLVSYYQIYPMFFKSR